MTRGQSSLARDIWDEIIYVLTIWIILTWSVMIIDIVSRRLNWEENYQNWEYNLTPAIPTGWEKAAAWGE